MNKMKAILHTQFGPPDELELKEIDKPTPKDNEVLIIIYTSTVTTTDCNVRDRTFVPKMFMFFAKVMFGFKYCIISRLVYLNFFTHADLFRYLGALGLFAEVVFSAN